MITMQFAANKTQEYNSYYNYLVGSVEVTTKWEQF